MTEPLSQAGEPAEHQVWQGICHAFAERDCFAYWRYPIFSKWGTFRKEPDILIADAEWGLIIIEVKSIAIDQIVQISGHRWELQQFYTLEANPYQQAEHQLYALLDYCNLEQALRRNVPGRAIVALPRILEAQWQQRGFDQLPSCPPILFQNHLEVEGEPSPLTLLERIQQAPLLIRGEKLSQPQWKLLQGVISGTPLFRPPSRQFFVGKSENQSDPTPRGAILAQVRHRISELDLQQERIAKSIPPGPQRIRGVAGSGKTVLLCQKAAQMHLKHPDWDIALVFFSRSLYEPFIQQVDQWLRRFSCNQIGYDRNNSQLKILHAWGSKNQPGFYSIVCQAAGVWSQSIHRTTRIKPNEALAEACCHLLQTAKIPAIFDAILIDEGQDLLVEDDLKFEGKQPFYWMAYQSLRPVQSQKETVLEAPRRLIWAYDELQSLDCLKIPTASELFGDEFGHIVIGEYENNINKTEIMSRSYRIPSPILSAAHAIAMGFFRPQGLLTGMTFATDWEALGYQVRTVETRHGAPLYPASQKEEEKNSPSAPPAPLAPPTSLIPLSPTLNPIPQLWKGSVIEFEVYRSRQEELMALADRIFYNLKIDGLRPSREILIIILGTGWEAIQLETQVANFLIQQGLDIFIPGTVDCNILKPTPDNANANQFWCEGGVTISRIHRAKGHEADMVYLVGLDQIAPQADDLTIRNQLFVALTRSRGWVRLTGINSYPFYEEIGRVIQKGKGFPVNLKQKPQRNISITDAGELLRRYQQGDRNFQGVNLSGIDLAGINLSNANLIGANLSNTNLTHANLNQAKLVVANLNQAQMNKASLQRAKLVGASLRQTQLNHCDLRRAELSDADLSQAQLVGAQLNDANLSGANLEQANLAQANLQGAILQDTIFTPAPILERTIVSEQDSESINYD